MKCIYCGSEMREGAFYCDVCGAPASVEGNQQSTVNSTPQFYNMQQDQQSVQPSGANMEQPVFGKPFVERNQYQAGNGSNGYTGYGNQTVNTPPSGYPNDQKKSGKGLIIALCAVIGVLVVGISIVLVLLMKKDKDPDGTKTADAGNTELSSSENYKEISTETKKDMVTEAATELITEAPRKGQTEAVTDMTAEPQTEEQVEMPLDENGEDTITSGIVSCMGGTVIVELDSYDISNNKLTIKVSNNNDKEITTFGLPTAIIDGRSVAIDVFSNMESDAVKIQPGSYALIDYIVDKSFFAHGGKLNGTFFSSGFESDKSYSLDISF